MRFDYYQATVREEPRVVFDTLSKLGHEVVNADGMARRYRYDQGFAIQHDSRGVVAHMLIGGNGIYPHAFASSDSTDEFVGLVREEWPDTHLVTRMDAAEDFNEAGAYERLCRAARKVAKNYHLKFPKFEDDLDKTAGRTQYVGSPKSDYRCRIYEKGWEQVAKLTGLFKTARLTAENFPTIKNTVTGEDVAPENWIRAELQVRPKGDEARSLAAHASPEQAWSFTPWSQELAKEALALELQRFYIRTRKCSKDEEALRWMCQQYGNMLYRLEGDLGDFACVGLEIGRILKEQAGRR